MRAPASSSPVGPVAPLPPGSRAPRSAGGPLAWAGLALALAACGPTIDQRATLVSKDGGVAAEDGPRLVQRLERAGMKAVLGPPLTATSLAVDTVATPELTRILNGLGEPTRVHVHAVRQLLPDVFPTRAEAEARLALWSPELGVVPTIVEERPASGSSTYRLLFREAGALVDAVDIEDAAPDGPDERGDARVVFALSEEASKRFEAWTGAHLESVLAIMVDDRVVGLPTLKSAIPGGRLLFFVDAPGTPEQRGIDARVKAAAIAGGPLRGTWTVDRVEALK